MRTKTAVGIVCVAIIVAFIMFLSRFSEELTKSESSKQLAEQENQTVVTESYSPTSAIAKAKALSREEPFREEAYQLFGLNLWSDQQETYLQFKERLFASRQLFSAFQNAKEESVSVFLGNTFNVGAGYIEINADVSDKEIINFLNSSMPTARAKYLELERMRREASQYGLFVWSSDSSVNVKQYKQMKARLSSNENLAFALRAAGRADITVFLDDKFSAGKGWVEINVFATDREIIEFLLGQ